MQHTDNPVYVSRVQTNAGFVEYEQGVNQRCTECGRQVNALYFTTAERTRLSVKCQIAKADFTQVAQTRADFSDQ